eukprot:COSAG04_NODE_531_length_12994_cov_3.113687_13_plen_212_part_00
MPAAGRLHTLALHLSPSAPPHSGPMPQGAAAESDSVTLANGVEFPLVGFGTGIGAADVEKHGGSSQAEVTEQAVNVALDAGYKAIDTAQRYGTEPPIGAVLAARFASGSLKREDVFITTKTSNPRPAPAGMLPGGGLEYMLKPEMSAYDGLLVSPFPTAPTHQPQHPPPPTSATNEFALQPSPKPDLIHHLPRTSSPAASRTSASTTSTFC